MSSASQRLITTFRLSPSLKEKLLKAGMRYLSDLDLEARPTQLAKDLGCSPDDALAILQTIKLDLLEGYQPDALESSGASAATSDETADLRNQYAAASASAMIRSNLGTDVSIKGRTAFDLLEESVVFTPIVTFNASIDAMLRGGIPIGKISEICGVPGIGKTQFGIQLAVDVHIPTDLGGTDGHCIYIDTEGSFSPDRAAEMATALVEHIHNIAGQQELATEVKHFTADYIQDHIYYYRVHDFIEQVALVNLLDEIIADLNNRNTTPIRLVVLDSITFLFRALGLFKDLSQRTRILNTMVAQLNQIADKHKVAVVLVNQVTTKPDVGVAPALGDIYALQLALRVMLEFDPVTQARKAVLMKSSEHRMAEAFYTVTREGIRDYQADDQN